MDEVQQPGVGITNVDIPQIMIGASYVIYFYYRLKVNKECRSLSPTFTPFYGISCELVFDLVESSRVGGGHIDKVRRENNLASVSTLGRNSLPSIRTDSPTLSRSKINHKNTHFFLQNARGAHKRIFKNCLDPTYFPYMAPVCSSSEMNHSVCDCNFQVRITNTNGCCRYRA